MFLKRFLHTPTALFYRRITHLKKLGFKPRTILDIGAYKGDWAKQIQKHFPGSELFLVEANQNHLPSLKQSGFNFTIALLGEKPKKGVNFYTTTKPFSTTGNSIYKEQTPAFKNAKIRKLPMTTLDKIVKKHQLNNVDLLKLDTQGSELDILKGGLKTIKKAEFILLETQNLTYNQNAPHIEAVFPFMTSLNFKLFDITQIHYLPTGEMSQLDLLFVKKSSKYLKTGILS